MDMADNNSSYGNGNLSKNNENGKNGNGRGKNSKQHKGHKKNGAPRQHHPWDEVSLPGSTNNIKDQATILEVFNQVQNSSTNEQSELDIGKTSTTEIGTEIETETETNTNQNINNNISKQEDEEEEANKYEPKEVLVESINIESESTIETPVSVNLVSNSSEKNKKPLLNINETRTEGVDLFADIETITVVPATPTATTPVSLLAHEALIKDNPHYLDIESHLIETTYDQSVEDSSVGIKELIPAKRELTQGSSKVENDEDNLRTIIEVEPVGVKTKQPIDTLHLRPTPLTQLTTEAKVANLNDLEHTVLKDAAEELVNDIEGEALQVLNTKQVELEAPKLLRDLEKGKLNNKTENEEFIESLDVTDHETLTQKVDEKLSEITSILKATSNSIKIAEKTETALDTQSVDVESSEPTKTVVAKQSLKVVDVPAPQTPHDEQERKLFIESLPQLGEQSQNTESETDAHKLSSACKREYYQSLKKYLIQSSTDKPPIPLQTYRWEDLRRAKERGGYPWTHLYKRPLGPDEEPEIVLLLRKSQELRFTSESPKSLKKVRIDEQVLVKETERYIQELSSDEPETDTEPDVEQDQNQTRTEEDEAENHSLHSESISCVSDSVLAAGKPRKTNRLAHIRALLKRRRSGRHHEDAQSLPGTSTSISANNSRVHSQETINSEPVTLQNEQLQLQNTPQHKSARCYPIMKKLRSMADRQKKRLNIKRITLKKDEKIALGEETKIMRLKNSPKCNRGEIPHFIEKQDSDDILDIVQLDESPSRKRYDDANIEAIEENTAVMTSHVQPDEIIEIEQVTSLQNGNHEAMPPRKTPRLRREHVYEEIEQSIDNDVEADVAAATLTLDSVAALKESLAKQDNSATHELVVANKEIPLDRMGSSEEEPLASSSHLLAPISSIDSTSSEEAERIKSLLSPVTEESDDGQLNEQELAAVLRVVQEHEKQDEQLHLKPSIKKEPSPAPSDKKVTFSHVEDEAEPHREDIELPDEVKEAVAIAKRDKTNSDHEYEAIGIPSAEEKPSLAKVESISAANQQNECQHQTTMDEETEGMHQAERVQKEFEERYFSSEATTPRTDSRTDYEIHTSQVDSSALEELPLKPENRRKTFMASAQDRTRRMQAGFKAQAGKIKTKLRSPMKKPTTPTGSPKAKDRKRFRTPDFSKVKMPEIKRPDMSKLKDFKRPEFTKFNKPDMSKFKMPEKFSTLKLRRSKSFKENEQPSFDSEIDSGMSPDSTAIPESHQHKKMFDFHFGTYPRAFRKKKPLETQSSLGTEDPSVIPSTETQPSLESSSSPKGDRGPGPVRSRWADKFSDVSYNDSEGSRYRRYDSEVESFDRESSLERRMKDDLEDTGSEVAPDLGILSGADDTRQFAEFDEENRAIHEISSQRAGEFKRRPMIHQDSDLRSEDSKDIGWTDKEVQKNKLLRKAELEAEVSYLKYPAEEYNRQETQSTASSGKKVVMEQIDDDEFFIRKRGISEDNIEFRQYISHAIREGYDTPLNALQHVGHTREPMEYDDYDVPPPKPRRLHKSSRAEDASQEFHSRSEFGDDLSISQNGSDFYPPKRPLRKGRSKYSMDSQDIPMTDEQLLSREQYFDDDEDYLRPPSGKLDNNMNDLNKTTTDGTQSRPQAPRRRKHRESSMDSYGNGLTGRSVSSSYLQPNEEVIVFRTEHQYPVPLATPEHYTDGSRSASRFGEDEQIQRMDADNNNEIHEKYVIDMMENDGYAVVRKEQVPKPTPPARRKKFSRSPGERFSTLPNMRMQRSSTSPPERPPPPRDYKPTVVYPETQPQSTRRKSAPPQNFGQENEEFEDDYEEPGTSMWRAESPRDLQSGDVINKMKYRPLPAPPRPPREKRLRGSSRGSSLQPTEDEEQNFDDRDGGGERIASSSTADSFDQHGINMEEVEAATQTDPLPDDFVCEEFEITPDMKVIKPRVTNKTLDELLRQEQQRLAEENEEDQQLTRGLQRFRDANQRSWSERSRASSQADRSRSLSRPQTPSSAVIIERRVSTPVSSAQQEQQPETMLAASLIVRPIDDLDLEEQALRREGLLTDSSQQSKSDAETEQQEEEAEETASKLALSDYSQEAASSIDLDTALEALRSEAEDSGTEVLKSEKEEKSQEDKDLDDLDVQALLDRIRQEEEEERKQQEYYENELKLLLEAEKALEMKQKLKEIEEKEAAEMKKLESEAEEARKLQEWVKLEKEKQEQEEEAQDFVNNLKEKIERDLQEKEAKKLEEKIKLEAQEDKKEVVLPQPPPRRKSSANIEISEVMDVAPTTATTASEISEEKAMLSALPTHISDLEVERLRVHALQAGQIMVGQLHGGQITSDELQCKSGNLIVRNLELPPGFIEDIVERVRSSERGQLLSTETQTSQHASNEQLLDKTEAQIIEAVDGQMEGLRNVRSLVPPPKPPRQRDLTAITHKNLNEETQTEATATANATAPMVPVFPTIEYLQSLAPLAFYNLEKQQQQQQQQQQQSEESHQHHHHRHHRPHYHRCESSGSESEIAATLQNTEDTETSTGRRHHHTRSPTAAATTTVGVDENNQSLGQASRQFISACSLALVRAINQLTSSLDEEKTAAVAADAASGFIAGNRFRQTPQQLLLLLVVVAIFILVFMLSGRNVHTHHWDYFNPPGNEGRPS